MRAEEILSASRDFRLREVVEAAVVEKGGVVVEVNQLQHIESRSIIAALAAQGHTSCPVLSTMVKSVDTRDRVSTFRPDPLSTDVQWAAERGISRHSQQVWHFGFDEVAGALYEGGDGEPELRHVARYMRAETPELGEAKWIFATPNSGVGMKGRLIPHDLDSGYVSEWINGLLGVGIQARSNEGFVDAEESTSFEAFPLENRSHAFAMDAGEESMRKVLVAMPKVLFSGLTLASVELTVQFFGLAAARVFSVSWNKAMARVSLSSGDVEAAWKKFHGVEVGGAEERARVFGVSVRSGAYGPSPPAPGATLAGTHGNALRNEVERQEAELRAVERNQVRLAAALAAAREAAEGERPREELFEEALVRGAARKILVDTLGTHILLPPLVFRETEVIHYAGKTFPPGVYRMPDAWAFVQRGRNALAVQVLTVDGFLHPHPHVQYGPGSGMLCMGETGEIKRRNEAALTSAWESDVAGWCDYLHNFLLSVWQDGLGNRYWPLVAIADRVGEV